MLPIFDILKSALPWVALIQFVLVYLVKDSARRSDALDQLPPWFKYAELFPAVYILMIAAMNYLEGNTLNAVVIAGLGLVIAIFILFPGKKEK